MHRVLQPDLEAHCKVEQQLKICLTNIAALLPHKFRRYTFELKQLAGISKFLQFKKLCFCEVLVDGKA